MYTLGVLSSTPMCGIFGFRILGIGPERAERVNRCLQHRGPDGKGVFYDVTNGLVLGHRRLSVLDLSVSGSQPMKSPAGRYLIVYNGEIYNSPSLRAEVLARGIDLKSTTDTEVILALFDSDGVEATLQRLDGMFAFALWDISLRCLYLVRDRFGEKPLYYGRQNGNFYFASELKGILAHGEFRREIEPEAVSAYLARGYVPSPLSIFKDVKKLAPGNLLKIGDFAKELPRPTPYFELSRLARGSMVETTSPEEARLDLKQLLENSVKSRLLSDVPVGAFLSGGIDSSLITAVMSQVSSRVRTFSIGFNEENYNEASYAKQVAAALGTDHSEHYVSVKDAQEVIPRLPEMYDEPFGDASQIPTFLVSKFARQSVTVCLSGDGGDELFGGYSRYLWTERAWRIMKFIPRPARLMLGRSIGLVGFRQWEMSFSAFGPVLPNSFSFKNPGDKVLKLAAALGESNFESLYERLVSHAPNAEIGRFGLWGTGSYLRKLRLYDLGTYFPDQILVKLDRATMACSLEGRIPMLALPIVEFALKLPDAALRRRGRSKAILHELLEEYLPRRLFNRPKMGFSVPIDRWLRGPLRAWAENLLSEDALNRGGLLNPKPIREAWERHLLDKSDFQYYLWDVLMLQAWRERWGL